MNTLKKSGGIVYIIKRYKMKETVFYPLAGFILFLIIAWIVMGRR